MGTAGGAFCCPSKVCMYSYHFQGDRKALEKIYFYVPQTIVEKMGLDDVKEQENGQQEWYWIQSKKK